MWQRTQCLGASRTLSIELSGSFGVAKCSLFVFHFLHFKLPMQQKLWSKNLLKFISCRDGPEKVQRQDKDGNITLPYYGQMTERKYKKTSLAYILHNEACSIA